MKQRLADYVADFLAARGVTDVFSVVGGGAMHLNDALGHNPRLHVTISIIKVQESGIHISIRDNGVGMSEEEQSNLFHRYYRGTNTKEKPEGSGLGLAIAKQIVTLHGGDIVVKSKLEEGTEFLILLPVN